MGRKNGLSVSRKIEFYSKSRKNRVLFRNIAMKRRSKFNVCYRSYHKTSLTLRVYGIGGHRRKLSVSAYDIDDYAHMIIPPPRGVLS